MDYQFEIDWQSTVKKIQSMGFEDVSSLDSVLFVIGVQELGCGFQTFSKDEKLQVIHIAVCKLLEPFGIYKYVGQDTDGWPHFERQKNLPPLDENDQEKLMKEAVIEYMKNY